MARPICLSLFMHDARRPASRAALMAGNNKPASQHAAAKHHYGTTDRDDHDPRDTALPWSSIRRLRHQFRLAGSLRNDHGRSAKGAGAAASCKLGPDAVPLFAQRTSVNNGHDRNSILEARIALFALIIPERRRGSMSAQQSGKLAHFRLLSSASTRSVMAWIRASWSAVPVPAAGVALPPVSPAFL